MDPSWREWVTGCCLALVAGVGVAAVHADTDSSAPAVAPMTGGYDMAPGASRPDPNRAAQQAPEVAQRTPTQRVEQAAAVSTGRGPGKTKKHGHRDHG